MPHLDYSLPSLVASSPVHLNSVCVSRTCATVCRQYMVSMVASRNATQNTTVQFHVVFMRVGMFFHKQLFSELRLHEQFPSYGITIKFPNMRFLENAHYLRYTNCLLRTSPPYTSITVQPHRANLEAPLRHIHAYGVEQQDLDCCTLHTRDLFAGCRTHARIG